MPDSLTDPERPSDSPSAARPTRILVDLANAAEGYVGISQDIRLIFAMLDQQPGVDVAGLLMPTGRHDVPRLVPGAGGDMAIAAGLLNWMAHPQVPRLPGLHSRLMNRLRELRRSLRRDHPLLRLDAQGGSSAVWRVLFQRTLTAEQRMSILARPFFATDLSVGRIVDRTNHLPFLPPKRLLATSFDFVLFGMPRPVTLAPGIRQLIRYHDAIPVTDPDTVESWKVGVSHQRLVQRCDPRAIFVCNSPQSAEDVVRLDPTREGQTVVIPCALAPTRATYGEMPFAAIVESRRTLRAGGGEARTLPPPALAPGSVPPYILTVSTLEPRKNYAGLIRAWERVIHRSKPDLRLVIVANSGWLEDETLAAMRPHVLNGRILHLQGLPIEELQSVARQALCFAFPSFVEGFGYPPLEALQAGTAVLVSDLPVFRWIFGDAALYVDPYDIEDIADGIERLTVHRDHASLRQELLRHRQGVIDRFVPDAVGAAWGALLARAHPRVSAVAA